LPSKKFYSDKGLPVSQVKEMDERLIRNMKEADHPFILETECDVLSVPESNKRKNSFPKRRSEYDKKDIENSAMTVKI